MSIYVSCTPNIDKKIMVINNSICRHIDKSGIDPRGAISQDVLAQLRNFVEHIMLKIYARDNDIDNSYENICNAISYVKSRGELKLFRKFHDFLQIVASHYTLDEENSERLMLKYYEYLLRIKKYMKIEYDFSVLDNLEKFPLNTDPVLHEYYEKIAKKIECYSSESKSKGEKYYIQKIKPFFVEENIYYEVTFTPANDHASKFNRVIAFTKLELTDYYAVRLTLSNEKINILDKEMPITIITGWEVSIRDCEFKNFTRLIRGTATSTGSSEQQAICRLLTSTGFNICDLLDLPKKTFNKVKEMATNRAKTVVFFEDLEECRRIVQKRKNGSNIIRYMLYHMNNKIMKDQWHPNENSNLSGLYFNNSSIPFDRMPFMFSPKGHNPKISDLLDCIHSEEHKDELFARFIRNNCEVKGQLFTSLKDISNFENIQDLITSYNAKLWSGHYDDSKLMLEKGQVYINGYKENTCYIINELKKYSINGIFNYSNSVKSWLNKGGHIVDCDEKRIALINMFENSKVAMIYGAAGTGKSTMINHIAHFFANKRKLFLTQTHPAKENLKRRVTASNCEYSTIASFVKSRRHQTEYDLVIIDECSTVSNLDMKLVLSKISTNLLVLVGDTFQISSIRFGNWFSVVKDFIPEKSVFELTEPFRADNKKLLTFWTRVRKMEDSILEICTRENYSVTLNSSIFEHHTKDEIILCLNYDGLYGINNINRFLQESNPNKAVEWGVQRYKIGDPILFNESERFSPVIYNNMKGKIIGIEILNEGSNAECIQFDIELDIAINAMDVGCVDFELIENSNNDNSIIRFCVNKVRSTDDDDDSTSKVIVPFQIAYAVSIHKAQGLEYDSVKIVITDEVDEMITHNIFYTAITRAKKELKIYWTPEVEKKVLSSIKPIDITKDINLLRQYI